MTRSLAQPDQVEHEAVSQAGAAEGVDGGTPLARRIGDRYLASPGLVPTAATLGLARRISRLSTGRLPLLDSVQRRWASTPGLFPQGISVLTYARLPGLSGSSSTPARVVQPALVGSARSPGVPRQRSRVAGPGGTASVQPASRAPMARPTIQREQPVQGNRDGRQPATGVGKPGEAVLPGNRGGSQRADGPDAVRREGAIPGPAGAGAKPRGETGTSHSELPMLRRVPSEPPGREAQREGATPERAGSVGKPDAGASTRRPQLPMLRRLPGDPAGREVQRQGAIGGPLPARAKPVVRPRAATIGIAEPSYSRTLVLRHQAGQPPGQAVQGEVDPSEPGHSEGRSATSDTARSPAPSGEGLPQPAVRGGQFSSGVRAAPTTTTGSDHLGMATVQRHLDGSVGRAIHRADRSPWPQRAAITVSRQSLAPGGTGLIVAHRLALAEHRGEQGSRADNTDPGQAVEVPAASGSVTTTGETLLPGTVHRLSETNIMRRLAVPPPRPTHPGVGMPGGAPGSSRVPGAVSQEMPLLQKEEGGAVGAGVEGTSHWLPVAWQVSRRWGAPGAPLDLAVQRAATARPVGRQPEPSDPVPPPPGDGPAAPAPAAPGVEGPDLERLADEVMAIIERRLTIQRESQGL
jgi:hypothetical protein